MKLIAYRTHQQGLTSKIDHSIYYRTTLEIVDEGYQGTGRFITIEHVKHDDFVYGRGYEFSIIEHNR